MTKMPSNRELLASMPKSPNATVTACQRWVLDNGPAIRLALERAEKAENLLQQSGVHLDGYYKSSALLRAKIDAYFAEVK